MKQEREARKITTDRESQAEEARGRVVTRPGTGMGGKEERASE